MCLTGVDYFSTLGYQPGIAALAAGLLSPDRDARAGRAHPVRCAAGLPPRGRGEPARRGLHRDARAAAELLEGQAVRAGRCSGFAATDFIITMTLSAADATAHLVENPTSSRCSTGHELGDHARPAGAARRGLPARLHRGHRHRGRRWSRSYLVLNVVVIGVALWHIAAHPPVVPDWTAALTAQHGEPADDGRRRAAGLPQAGAGLSGFETGVAVMPHVNGDASDTERRPGAAGSAAPAGCSPRPR